MARKQHNVTTTLSMTAEDLLGMYERCFVLSYMPRQQLQNQTLDSAAVEMLLIRLGIVSDRNLVLSLLAHNIHSFCYCVIAGSAMAAASP